MDAAVVESTDRGPRLVDGDRGEQEPEHGVQPFPLPVGEHPFPARPRVGSGHAFEDLDGGAGNDDLAFGGPDAVGDDFPHLAVLPGGDLPGVPTFLWLG